MNYQVFQLISPYLNKNTYIFSALVCREWHKIINKDIYSTPYSCLTTKSLLSYADKNLKLVYNKKGFIIIGGLESTINMIGDFESIKYLHTKTDIMSPLYSHYATSNGNLEIMKWFRSNGCGFTDNTFGDAALNGNLENMKWLLENGCHFNYDTFTRAAENGNLENMKWLFSYGCKFDGYTFDGPAKHGNLDTMKWLLENGCGFGHNTFNFAVKNGNLDNMKWLKSNKCPFDNYTFKFAAQNGNQENIEWLKANGCPQ